MKQRQFTFPCGDLKLEGIYFDLESRSPMPAVVVCHPHPLYGGSMRNNVTFAVAGVLAERSIAALLFNFRGVGRSQGSYGGGSAEQKDILSALDWLQEQAGVDAENMGLAGYSFGAGVALPVACSDERVKGVALISPYFEGSDHSLLKTCVKPKLIVSGSSDYAVAPDQVAIYGKEAAEPKQLEIIEGADHFWGGCENKMSEAVARFFASILI